ncbi:FecR family protein [Fodinibius salsisoli]|uniref:FecR domain-containing protein n=1 Tax=Fodinibius salsisoli TaxID=2820877 RepID=A0ABT3PJG2_9BACT|nr:FecR domain-containing protein [Fodinibius salsisoli]MCW9706067.1 FecR domain-containing protein [Fodinibius salsisoli]
MNWEILRKYKDGSCSEQELRQLGEWLEENPANEDFFQTFIESDSQSGNTDFYPNAQAAWKQFKKTYGMPAPLEMAKSRALDSNREAYATADFKRGRGYWYSFSAAAVILIAALSLVGQQFMISNEQTRKEEVAVQEITTLKGQRTNLRLSDGTHVTLNAESKLEIPENYGEPSRTIYLDGEAFFDVPHDEEHPFLVITPRGYVKDLGTQFNVMTYDSSKIEVAVKEGLVSMGKMEKGTPQKELVELTPNKLGILENVGGLTVSDIKDINVFTGWVNGKLIFKRTPFSEVVKRLERWFDIECSIEGSQLAKRTLTASYEKMSLEEVLEVLSISLRVSYDRQGKKIIFQDNS